MSTQKCDELDVVELRDGKRGTVVHVYHGGNAMCIEISGTNDLIDVKESEIKKVLWKYKGDI